MLHNPVRILLVDDDEDDFIITSELLSEIPDHRYDIHWSSDYQKAIQTLECKDFDICLFDYSLGAECGLDLLEDVINRGYDIPIILLTGQNNKEIDQKALEAGASDYLDKSELNSSLLERSIRYALERHNTLTELKHDQKIFKGGPVVVFKWEASKSYPVEYVSSNVIQFGYLAKDLITSQVSFLSLIHEEDQNHFVNLLNNAVKSTDMSLEVDYRFRIANDKFKWVYSYTVIIRDHNKSPSHFYGYILDITERKQAEDKLSLAANVYQNTNEGILVTDSAGFIQDINPAFTRITGYTESEAIGKHPTFLMSGEQDQDFYHLFNETLHNTGNWQGEIWNRRKNGQTYPQWLNISSITNEQGEPVHYVGVFSDITEIKLNQEKLKYLAHHDPLTELPNRLLFQDRLNQSISAASRNKAKLALLFFDLDGFKLVNDSLGHGVGDKMLRITAERIKDCVRQADTVARVGGDEFAAIVPELKTAEDAAKVAKKIIQALAEQFQISDNKLFISASLGIAIYPNDGQDSEELLKNADIAMYYAKEKGKNNYQFYSPKMTDSSLYRFEMENQLRKALQNDAFKLFFQPQINLISGETVGVEALVYWQNNGNLIRACDFIQAAEESGLIIPIGNWVIREACHQIKLFQENGHKPIPVAVNLAAKEFENLDLLSSVESALKDSGLDSRYLDLELKETSIMRDPEKSLKTINLLKDRGLNISIDDFGTGFSNIGYLRRFPIDRIKIDHSLIKDICLSQDGADITKTIIAMARSLNIQVIAEGVENCDQASFLLDNNCEAAQGYHFSKPLSASDMRTYLSSQKK